MAQKRLKTKLSEKKEFVIVAELTGGAGYNFEPIFNFLEAYQKAGAGVIPAGFDFTGVMLPQNPGGVANIDPGDVLAMMLQKGLAGDLDIIPHISCKDSNADGLTSSLVGYRQLGVETVLALTGDKPVKAKGVFEVESVGLLGLIGKMNNEALLKSKPEELAKARRFYAGSAVSPFKYTEASQMQQYYKMEKKVAAGAGFLVTQVGWDWKKSVELMQYLKNNRIDVPVLGNVFCLTTLTPAPRLMHDGKLPGCYVSDALLDQVKSETIEGHVERAAQQVAMYRSIGAGGVDIGGVHDFAMFVKILNRAADIGEQWRQYADNLYWPAENPFYLYRENGAQVGLSIASRRFHEKFFDFMHRAILDPDYRGFRAFRKTLHWMRVDREKSCTYKAFNAIEKAFKYATFDCQECGDCYLPENFGYCTLGCCEKGVDNAPCGDATATGFCGNNLERQCVGERVYQAAAAHPGGRDRLRQTINRPRNAALRHSSSLVNYLFGKDHTMKRPLIEIGESIHASIPKTGAVMRQLHDLGPDAYDKPSPQLDYIRAQIESQAGDGASYIAVNLDAFGESDSGLAVEMMKQYVRLVRKWGQGVPVCIDSSNDEVLVDGLKEWYAAGIVKPPLLNSIKTYTADKMMPLRKQYEFSFIGLLVSEDKPTGPGGSHSVDELFGLAQQIYNKAMQFGFKPQEIFFDATVFPLAIDMPMEPGVPGYTYRAFNTIKKIKSDPQMKACHFSLGVSNCCRDLPGRKIGICRAYVALAMQNGLDAGIVNIEHHYGEKPADPELLELVGAFALLDGSMDKLNDAMMKMGQFCASVRKPE